jgi:hypothetical protein
MWNRRGAGRQLSSGSKGEWIEFRASAWAWLGGGRGGGRDQLSGEIAGCQPDGIGTLRMCRWAAERAGRLRKGPRDVFGGCVLVQYVLSRRVWWICAVPTWRAGVNNGSMRRPHRAFGIFCDTQRFKMLHRQAKVKPNPNPVSFQKINWIVHEYDRSPRSSSPFSSRYSFTKQSPPSPVVAPASKPTPTAPPASARRTAPTRPSR